MCWYGNNGRMRVPLSEDTMAGLVRIQQDMMQGQPFPWHFSVNGICYDQEGENASPTETSEN